MKRRTFLTSALLGTGAAALSPAAPASARVVGPAGNLTAQTTEGPYYLALDLMRADITEGLSGIPLDVAFSVVDNDGRPCAGSLVDIWHCDAQGAYSGFEQPGTPSMKGKTFLRGTQAVGADGTVVFHTLYPGWYRGRTTHIHFKVRRGALTNLTSQFFLPDTLSEFLYTQVSAYHRDELRDTLNSSDGIAIEAGPTVEGNVREANSGNGEGRYVATLTVRVDPTANPTIDRPPAPGGQFPHRGDKHADGHMLPPPGDGKGGSPDGHPDGPPNGPPPSTAALMGDQRVAALLPNADRSAARPFGPLPGAPKA